MNSETSHAVGTVVMVTEHGRTPCAPKRWRIMRERKVDADGRAHYGASRYVRTTRKFSSVVYVIYEERIVDVCGNML